MKNFLILVISMFFCCSLQAQTSESSLLQITIQPSQPYFDAWAIGNVTLTVENQSSLSLLLSHLSLSDQKQTIVVENCLAPIQGELKENRFAIFGEYFVEYLLMEARSPAPPRWEWYGKDQLMTLKILAPGAKLVLNGKFRATYEAGTHFVARVDYLAIDPGMPMYKMSDQKFKAMGLPASLRHGWEKEAELILEYIPAQQFDVQEELVFSTRSGNVALRLFPYAMLQKHFRKLTPHIAKITHPLHIKPLSFDIAAAREKCGTTSGAYTYAIASQCWVIADLQHTYLVSEQDVIVISGDAIPLANTLNEKANARVFLDIALPPAQAQSSQEPDFGNHLAYFAKLGFHTDSQPQKGGGYENSVLVPPDQFIPFAQAVEDRGFYFVQGLIISNRSNQKK